MKTSYNPLIDNEINELLQQFLLQVQYILEDQFIGLYIGGSLTTNSFNCETSDIDCYIIAKDIFTKNIIDKLEEMHKQFYLNKLPYAKRIEASYISQKHLLNFHSRSKRPYFNEGNFYLAHYGSNFIIELYILKENGIIIAGPNIKKLIKEISTQNLKLAVHKNLYEYWESTLKDIAKFSRSDYQVFAILTMCRTLYSLKTGKVASKKEAAHWAISKLDDNWKTLLEQALAWKPNQELNKFEETQQFVRYILNKSRGED